ncbi:MAG: rod shape-determining protein MreC [Deltaproteobacteria bacterium]|nr:rod shape-determining protein MreC [Deltaproteobacteria bacterium]
MFDLLWRYRKQLFVALLFGLAVYVVALRDKDEDEYNAFDHLLVKVTAPIQAGLTWLGDAIADGWHHYVENRRAAEQNDALRNEVYDLRRRLRVIDEVRRENHRLLGLLGLAERSKDVEYKAARVIANSSSSQFRSIRIDQGSDEGVVRGMGVVAEAGLVGRVMAVETHYADVMLISDASSTIDIVVGRTRARGRLRGLGDSTRFRARIDYLVRTAAVEVGDDVITTGAGKVFPKGIFVGYVAAVNKSEHGLYQEAIVEPPVSLFALDEVFVIVGFGPEAFVDLPPREKSAEELLPSAVDPNSVKEPEFDPDAYERDLLWTPEEKGPRDLFER